ncbi:DUF1287 domain-containing protein [Rheinheimera sp.]|uniref:DUF1287 domain-containing protein n=1 Tax=Rheinheimera sp. TaxID=1869214 RepID=UPI0027327254|nr:DUF1287 domain-containing protein [Rheinheimera sp.]MDP2713522.1 DUF1287 domain-containing protein [Rheinheimera sp.]
MPVFLLPRLLTSTLALVLWLVPQHSIADTFSDRLVAAALERTQHQVRYDGRYLRIAYPGGDVPADIGVCTDVVIRSYRALGIDLQQLVHEDMQADFDLYPSKRIWGLTKPDSNIDHRRVPNLQTFFSRHGERLPISRLGSDYQPGDLVTWLLPGNLPHIGIVTDKRSADDQRPLIVHNIGAGPVLADMLFAYKITGHYRFNPGADAQ